MNVLGKQMLATPALFHLLSSLLTRIHDFVTIINVHEPYFYKITGINSKLLALISSVTLLNTSIPKMFLFISLQPERFTGSSLRRKERKEKIGPGRIRTNPTCLWLPQEKDKPPCQSDMGIRRAQRDLIIKNHTTFPGSK